MEKHIIKQIALEQKQEISDKVPQSIDHHERSRGRRKD